MTRPVAGLWAATYAAALIAVAATTSALDKAIAGAATDADHAILTASVIVAAVALVVATAGYRLATVRGDGSPARSIAPNARTHFATALAVSTIVLAVVRSTFQIDALVDHIRSRADEPLTTVEGALRVGVTLIAAGLLVAFAWNERRLAAHRELDGTPVKARP